MKRTVLKKILSLVLGGGILFSSNMPVLAATNLTLSTPIVQGEAESKNNYNSFTFTKQNSPIAKGDISLTNGASCNLYISVQVNNVTSETNLKNFIKSNEVLFTPEQYSKITSLPSYTKTGYGAELLYNFIAIVFNNGSNKSGIEINGSASNDAQQQLLNGLHDLSASSYLLKGTQKAVSISYIPTVPYCWIQVSKLTFPDGKTIKILNTQTTIGDEKGSTDHFKNK